jgi:hypothetical protein
VIAASDPGCPPLLNVTLHGNSRENACRAHNDAVMKKALGPNIKRVILAGRWAEYAEALRVGSGEVTMYMGNDSFSESAHVFATVLENTVKRLVQAGKEVVIMGPIPEHDFDVTSAVARHLAWNQPLPHEPTFSTFLQREHRVMTVLAGVAGLPNVRVIYPHLTLCGDGTCHYSKNGKPLYSDSHHLNAAGVAELHDIFSELFATNR